MGAKQLKSWTLELWALGGTLAMMAALVVLLAVFDGRVIFDQKAITLNTIVSTLSVIMKALLLFTAAECIGQWKWILLHHDKRSLLDFERIDLASRGPLGCLELIWRGNTPWLLRIGLVVTILAIAVDPFSQQLVQIQQGIHYVDDIYGTKATTPRSTNYRLGGAANVSFSRSLEGSGDVPVSIVTRQADLRMEAAMVQGLAQSLSVVQQQVDVVCPPSAANCTFDRFETLGVCHRCADLTEDLARVDDFGDFFNHLEGKIDDEDEDSGDRTWRPENGTAFALPNGHFLANTNSCRMTEADMNSTCRWGHDSSNAKRYAMTAYGTGHPNRTNRFRDIDTLIWSTSVIHMDEKARLRRDREDDQDQDTPELRPWNYWPSTPLQATECALYYCVKEIDDEFEGNLVRERAGEAPGFRRTPESFLFNLTELGYELAPENIPDEPGSLVFDKYRSVVRFNDLTLKHTTRNTSYVVGEETVKSISSFFQDTLLYFEKDTERLAKQARKKIPSAVELWNGYIVASEITTKGVVRPHALGGIWRDSDSDVRERFETLATSMTNDMRRNRGQYETYNTEGNLEALTPEEPFVGRISLVKTEYRVVWYWITLHGVVQLGSVLFCVVTILYSRNVPVWKSHSLATMSQGAAIIEFGSDAGTVEELEKRAENIMVSLAGDEGSRLLKAQVERDHSSRESIRLESIDLQPAQRDVN